MEVVPGIHKVNGTWGGNVYLLVEESGLALIDAALPWNAGKILRYIRSLDRDPAELRYIILTHAHPDHTGTIPELRLRADLRVLVHPHDVRTQKDGRLRLHYPGHLITVPWNVPLLRRIYAEELLEEGQ